MGERGGTQLQIQLGQVGITAKEHGAGQWWKITAMGTLRVRQARVIRHKLVRDEELLDMERVHTEY